MIAPLQAKIDDCHKILAMMATDYAKLREGQDDERLSKEEKEKQAAKVVSQSLNNSSIYLNLASQVLIELANLCLGKTTAKIAGLLIVQFTNSLPMVVHHADRLLKWAGEPVFKLAKRSWQGFLESVDNFWCYTKNAGSYVHSLLVEFRIAFQKLWQKFEKGGAHLAQFAKENPFILCGIIGSIGLVAASVVYSAPTLVAAGITAGVTGVALAFKNKK